MEGRKVLSDHCACYRGRVCCAEGRQEGIQAGPCQDLSGFRFCK